MDPRGVGTIAIELNNTCAQLLAKLCVELETDDVQAVLSRALGLLEMSLFAKRRGDRLCFINEHGEAADVVI